MDVLDDDDEEDVDLSFEMSNDGFHPNTSRDSDEDQDPFSDESKKNSSKNNGADGQDSNEFDENNASDNKKLGKNKGPFLNNTKYNF